MRMVCEVLRHTGDQVGRYDDVVPLHGQIHAGPQQRRVDLGPLDALVAESRVRERQHEPMLSGGVCLGPTLDYADVVLYRRRLRGVVEVDLAARDDLQQLRAKRVGYFLHEHLDGLHCIPRLRLGADDVRRPGLRVRRIVELRGKGECPAAVGHDRRRIGVCLGLVTVDAVNNGDVVEDGL